MVPEEKALLLKGSFFLKSRLHFTFNTNKNQEIRLKIQTFIKAYFLFYFRAKTKITFEKKLYLKQIELLKFQTKAIKKFTELGYEVMNIPPDLYETLKSQKNEKSLRKEDCQGLWVCVRSGLYLHQYAPTHLKSTLKLHTR